MFCFVFDDGSIQKSLKWKRKTRNKLQNKFWTWTCWRLQLYSFGKSYVSLFLTYLQNIYQKRIDPLQIALFLCKIKRLQIAVFLLTKWTIKTRIAQSSFWLSYMYRKHTFLPNGRPITIAGSCETHTQMWMTCQLYCFI